MAHLGSVTDIDGREIEPVDIITFGSPCQDLSVAGKRAGMKHSANGDDETTRSGLFMEAVRIIKEMRRATNGEYPKFAIWENVPGAFSSNKGEDFRTVLEELIKICEPEAPPVPSPGKAGWPYADCIVGDGFSLAWRVFNAQHWGTAQRRRRVYAVLDLTGERAEKVLFEREGLRGYFEKGRSPWQGDAGDPAESIETDDPKSGVTQRSASDGNIAATLYAAYGTKWNGNAGAYSGENFVLEERCKNAATYGISSYESRGMRSSNPHAGIYEATTSRTLDLNGGYPATHQGGIAIVDQIGGQGEYYQESNVSSTLRSGGLGAIAIPTKCSAGLDGSQVSNTLIARMSSTVGTTQDNLIVADYRDEQQYIVRRLTPTECARLQGFPDRWGDIPHKDTFTDEEYSFWLNVRNTHATINGRATKEYTREQLLRWYNKLHSDSSEYKMWGNGIALPNALYVLQGIAEVISNG